MTTSIRTTNWIILFPHIWQDTYKAITGEPWNKSTEEAHPPATNKTTKPFPWDLSFPLPSYTFDFYLPSLCFIFYSGQSSRLELQALNVRGRMSSSLSSTYVKLQTVSDDPVSKTNKTSHHSNVPSTFTTSKKMQKFFNIHTPSR